jgi:hypothetical protein
MITLAPHASHGQSASSVVQLTAGETTLRCAAGEQLVLRPVDARSVVGQCLTASASPTPPVTPPATVQEAFFYNAPRAPLTVADVAQRAAWVVGHGSGTRYQDELRAAGYTGRVLRYQLANEVEGPQTVNSAAPCDVRYDPLGNQAASNVGDFCRLIHPHEDWFLHNGKGERLYLSWHPDRRTYAMNSAHSGWRAFALQRMQAAQQGYDGLFLDNVELDVYKLQRQYQNSDGVVREFATNDAFRAAIIGYLQALAPLRQNGLLEANVINDPLTGTAWDAYLPFLDGVLQEAWATGYDPLTPARWERNLRQTETALAQGKAVVMVARGAPGDDRQLLFGLASYLLVTNGRSAYFRYSDDGGQYVRWPTHARYDVQLGAARGPRYQLPDGRWRRDFERGSVTVDPAARIGTITP